MGIKIRNATEIIVKVVNITTDAVISGYQILSMIPNVVIAMNEINCDDDRGRCDDYHEGLCMATTNRKGHPMKITRMKKCPFGTIEDVLK